MNSSNCKFGEMAVRCSTDRKVQEVWQHCHVLEGAPVVRLWFSFARLEAYRWEIHLLANVQTNKSVLK